MPRANAYKMVQVNTASPERVMVRLFEGALRHMRQSRAAIERQERGAFHEGIRRAAEIVIELQSSLKSDVAPQLCEDLSRVYTFVVGRLMLAAATSDPRTVGEAERVFAPVVDAFVQAAAQRANEPRP
jgi:flagellar protein FliS